MYALIEGGVIAKTFNNPRRLVVNNIRYSTKIYSLWSKEEKESIGLYEVVYDNSNKRDEDWYINTNETLSFADGVVTASYGSATARLLEDRNEVDEDDNPLLDSDGNQVVTKGLKTIKKEMIDRQCAGLLQDSDWRVIKAKETGTTMDAGWKSWRASVRTKCNSMQDQIDGASDVDALATLFTRTETDGVTSRPLGEFPIKE
jgi:hypothetical protein|tara:strand:- start:3 stop:608 length:606 start_codon:yes stop_codon:yes gene_type:complete